MTTLMGTKQTCFAATQSEAEQLVEDAKAQHGSNLRDHTIARRTKKEVEFFIVTIVVQYYKISDLVVTE